MHDRASSKVGLYRLGKMPELGDVKKQDRRQTTARRSSAKPMGFAKQGPSAQQGKPTTFRTEDGHQMAGRLTAEGSFHMRC